MWWIKSEIYKWVDFSLLLICKFSKEIYVIEKNQLYAERIINKKVISLANKANKIIILIKIFDKKAFCKTGYNKTTITKTATKNIDALIM